MGMSDMPRKGITKIYEGENGRYSRVRGTEHVKDLEKNRQKSVLYKYKMSDHKN